MYHIIQTIRGMNIWRASHIISMIQILQNVYLGCMPSYLITEVLYRKYKSDPTFFIVPDVCLRLLIPCTQFQPALCPRGLTPVNCSNRAPLLAAPWQGGLASERNRWKVRGQEEWHTWAFLSLAPSLWSQWRAAALSWSLFLSFQGVEWLWGLHHPLLLP